MNIRIIILIVLSMLSALLSGCCAMNGTILTRTSLTGRHSDTFGAYPYQAVYEDGYAMTTYDGYATSDDKTGTTMRICGFISLPLDILFDTIFLPVDLVAWSFGASKGWRYVWEKKGNSP